MDTLHESLERLRQRFAGISAKSRGANLGDAPARVINWFRDMPSVPKLVVVGLVLLLILTVLSPLALIAAALLFGVSFIALIIRVVQRGSIRGWVIVAVASLASLFVFGGISDALYSTGFLGASNSASSYEVLEEGEAPIEGDLGVSLLESMVRGGMVDSDQYVLDVRTSGESATVVISSDAPEGYAESVCDFALDAALEYDSQTGYADYISITYVSVKKPWRPWSTASCSL